jgi:hypothetical protein
MILSRYRPIIIPLPLEARDTTVPHRQSPFITAPSSIITFIVFHRYRRLKSGFKWQLRVRDGNGTVTLTEQNHYFYSTFANMNLEISSLFSYICYSKTEVN